MISIIIIRFVRINFTPFSADFPGSFLWGSAHRHSNTTLELKDPCTVFTKSLAFFRGLG
jgi:hypothetical protein